jgi:hypothetical protein
MNIITESYFQIEGDINNETLLELFYKETGIKEEMNFDSYGSGCYGFIPYEEISKTSLLKIETIMKGEKFETEDENYMWVTDKVIIDEVLQYLQHKEILPKMDFLFQVSY